MKHVLCLCLLLLSSCGYRMAHSPGNTLFVPFVEGDKEGLFTAALVSEIAANGQFVYSSCDADLILKVCLGPPRSTNVGFTYAPSAKFTVSNEARLSMSAKVSLIEAESGRCVLGPLALSSFLRFDFEPDLSNIEEHAFSLGQSEMHPLAKQGATPPLYAKLAQKIVDSVANCW